MTGVSITLINKSQSSKPSSQNQGHEKEMGKMMVVVKARTRIREECRHENESGEIFKMRD